MTPYEAGFAEGEQAGYIDRQAGKLKVRPPVLFSQFDIGWWDGYCPGVTWALTRRPVRSFHEQQEHA